MRAAPLRRHVFGDRDDRCEACSWKVTRGHILYLQGLHVRLPAASIAPKRCWRRRRTSSNTWQDVLDSQVEPIVLRDSPPPLPPALLRQSQDVSTVPWTARATIDIAARDDVGDSIGDAIFSGRGLLQLCRFAVPRLKSREISLRSVSRDSAFFNCPLQLRALKRGGRAMRKYRSIVLSRS